MKKLLQKQRALLSVTMIACGLAGCGTTEPGSVAALRRIVGTDLIGTKGVTPTDQNNINRTVIRLGAAGIYTKQELVAHGNAVQPQ